MTSGISSGIRDNAGLEAKHQTGPASGLIGTQ